MSPKQFARDLVMSGELDPPYVLFYNLQMVKSAEWIDVAVMHYFLFYDLEGAVKAADEVNPVDYWQYILDRLPTLKRGKARRHFRGEAAQTAICRLKTGSVCHTLERMYKPTYALLALYMGAYSGCQIGPYFTWKLMDIFDRCLGREVQLSLNAAVEYLPDVPRKAVKQFFPGKLVADALQEVVSWIDDLSAPGVPTRNCSYAEAETVLCAMYGMNKGTYKFGSDLIHRRGELKNFPQYAMLLPIPREWNHYDGRRLESPTISA